MTISNARLFPDCLLYSEGRPKPVFRGLLHAVGVLILCPYMLVQAYTSSSINCTCEMIAVGLFITGTAFCWSCSALYHCKSWSSQYEIFLQRLGKTSRLPAIEGLYLCIGQLISMIALILLCTVDHGAIFICIACALTPLPLILFREAILQLHLSLITVVMIWICAVIGFWKACSKTNGVATLGVLNVAFILPILPDVCSRLTSEEKLLGLSALFLMIVGAVAFCKEVLDLFPSTFGHHEVRLSRSGFISSNPSFGCVGVSFMQRHRDVYDVLDVYLIIERRCLAMRWD